MEETQTDGNGQASIRVLLKGAHRVILPGGRASGIFGTQLPRIFPTRSVPFLSCQASPLYPRVSNSNPAQLLVAHP